MLSNIKTNDSCILLPTRSEGRGVLRIGSIPVATLPSCQYDKRLHNIIIMLYFNKYSWVVKMRNNSVEY